MSAEFGSTNGIESISHGDNAAMIILGPVDPANTQRFDEMLQFK